MNVKPLFKLMVEKKASDLFFAPFAPAKIKIDGKIMPVNKLEMTPEMVKQAAIGLMDDDQLESFTRELEIDFAISEPGLGRFRVNVFHQRGNVAMVLRYITSELPTLDELGMPEQMKELVMLRRGLILMVGATGSGKSTTLAAMINHRNEKTSSHIITIEDPIEFLHPNKQSIVNQREVGLDTKSYSNALKSAMRGAPDVLQIGEIRDHESMQSAIDMAGTGHLVLATLHSNNAPETLDRIINMFPQEQHAQVFMDLGHYLRAILSQRLVRARTGKRVAAVELLLNTPHIKDLILKGDISEVKEALKDSGEKGMQNFDEALLSLYQAGTITLEEAMSHADEFAAKAQSARDSTYEICVVRTDIYCTKDQFAPTSTPK
jgi:twitching motility protein PilU